MRTNVDVDRLMQQNQGDPKKTAKNLQTMQKAGVNLHLQVRTIEATKVFEFLGHIPPWRLFLNWMLKLQGLVASIGVGAYVGIAILMF